MSKPLSDELLQDFTRGFAFDESIREQLNFEQMIAVADTFLGWALDKSNGPKRCAWLPNLTSRSLCRRQDQLIVGLVKRHPKARKEAHSQQSSFRQTRVHDERHRDIMRDHPADP